MVQKLNNEISLESITVEKYSELYGIFKACRTDLVWITGLSEEEQEKLLKTQFEMEKHQFSIFYPKAHYQYILLKQEPIGRLFMDYGEKHFRVLDIGIIEAHRKKGIGRVVLASVINEATKQNKTVSLQVAWFNEVALKFYMNLGFSVIENNGVVYEMQYTMKD